MGIRCRH